MTFFGVCHADRVISRARAILAKPYSGMVVGVAVTLVALALLTAGYGFGLNWAQAWRVIGFPGVALPPFFDLHIITTTAAQCAASGESYPFIKCGYASGKYNYPPVWLLLGALGISGNDTAWLAVLIELSAIILLIVLLRGHSIVLGLLALPMVLSPSTILAFERANSDIVEWILVCLAAFVFSERDRIRLFASLVLLAAAIAFKFIAVFCVALFLRFSKFAMIAAIVLIAFTGMYLLSLAEVLPWIRKITPVSPYISFGYVIIFDRIEFIYAPKLGLNVTGLTTSWIPLAGVVAAIFTAAVFALLRWRRNVRYCPLEDNRDGVAFLFGAGIFCGSFLFLGTNYTYRLIFLLLCLPQIFIWLKNRYDIDPLSRKTAYVLCVSFIFSMWFKFRPEYTLHINQITDWTIFGILSAIMMSNALHWLPTFGIRDKGPKAIS